MVLKLMIYVNFLREIKRFNKTLQRITMSFYCIYVIVRSVIYRRGLLVFSTLKLHSDFRHVLNNIFQ